jgi:Plasmid pRiA4b ORF-3-like protein
MGWPVPWGAASGGWIAWAGLAFGGMHRSRYRRFVADRGPPRGSRVLNVDMAVSGDELRDAAQFARESRVVGRAVTLARWIGAGRRPVTAGQVLRKADVPAAGAAVGVEVPPRLRTMADIRALHRPWCVAVATGLLQVGGGWVTAGPALERWPPGEADLLAAWLTGLRAVCAAESYPQDEDSVRLLAMALLEVLRKDGPFRTGGLWGPVHATLHDLCGRYDKSSWEPLHAADRYYDLDTGTPLVGLVALLAEFGAVAGDAGKPVITSLGCWAAGHLAAGLPGLADPGLPAGEMIAEAARFGDEEQRDHVAWGWLAERRPAGAAREILTAAEGMPPLLRSVAVGVAQRLGDEALPAWRELTAAPRVGPHARAVMAAWGQGPEPADADWDWLAVEAAAAALQDKGPDAALTRVWESMPGADLDTCLAQVRATGHPDAAELSRAVAAFVASGAPCSIDRVAELKVSLARFRPLIWRRVRLPVTATLADLHEAVQVLFGWDGDHLHVFRAGKKQYSDPFVNLEGTADEGAVRVWDVLTPGGKISYTYDLGACWEHEITLEQTLTRDPGQDYPVCVAYKGDPAVEYWCEDDPEEPEPFGLAEVNRKLATLGEAEE